MPFRIRAVVVLAGLLWSSAVLAGEARAPRAVVELFTSQGCASCPPADTTLAQLVKQGDLVVLSYHVDYWNYLGWTDTLSSKENTERQYGYAKTMGRSGVYTPQAIINGREHVKGTDLAVVNSRVDDLEKNGQGLSVPVSASMKGTDIEIEIGEGHGQAEVVVAYFTKQQTVDVTKGENSGKNMDYWHAVYDVQSVGTWNGSKTTLTLPGKVLGKGKKDGCAILLQTSGPSGEPATILGATVLMAGRKKN